MLYRELGRTGGSLNNPPDLLWLLREGYDEQVRPAGGVSSGRGVLG